MHKIASYFTAVFLGLGIATAPLWIPLLWVINDVGSYYRAALCGGP